MSPYDTTYNQPTLTPTRKITAVAIGGMLSTLVTWILSDLLDVPIPPEVSAAIAGLLAAAAGYLTKEKML